MGCGDYQGHRMEGSPALLHKKLCQGERSAHRAPSSHRSPEVSVFDQGAHLGRSGPADFSPGGTSGNAPGSPRRFPAPPGQGGLSDGALLPVQVRGSGGAVVGCRKLHLAPHSPNPTRHSTRQDASRLYPPCLWASLPCHTQSTQTCAGVRLRVCTAGLAVVLRPVTTVRPGCTVVEGSQGSEMGQRG